MARKSTNGFLVLSMGYSFQRTVGFWELTPGAEAPALRRPLYHKLGKPLKRVPSVKQAGGFTVAARLPTQRKKITLRPERCNVGEQEKAVTARQRTGGLQHSGQAVRFGRHRQHAEAGPAE